MSSRRPGDQIVIWRYGESAGVVEVARPAGSLTHARTSFAGRSGAVDQVAELLASYQLVTITGPGGVGKTRLADEALKRVAGRFADGVAVVELAAVSEPALVAATAATALQVRLRHRRQADRAGRLLRRRRLVVTGPNPLDPRPRRERHRRLQPGPRGRGGR